MNIDNAPALPRLVGIAEVSRLTSLKPTAIYDYINRGELPRVKLGKKTVFLEADVIAFIERKVAQSRQLEAA